MCAVLLANHHRAVADTFCPLRAYQRYWKTQQLRGDIHKSKVLLIPSTLLLVSSVSLMAEFCFHRFVHFIIVFRYIFSAFTTSSVLTIRGTALL